MEEGLMGQENMPRENVRAEAADVLGVIREGLELPPMNPMDYSPLTLAYVGDDVYDLIIRSYLLSKGNNHVDVLNRMANSLVKAKSQSAMMGVLEPLLTPEELSAYKRGRNAKSYTRAKNATVADYRRATGFEALVGYLYIKGDMGRVLELVKTGLEKTQLDGRPTN
jgi:ribonuclease-3 family protein